MVHSPSRRHPPPGETFYGSSPMAALIAAASQVYIRFVIVNNRPKSSPFSEAFLTKRHLISEGPVWLS